MMVCHEAEHCDINPYITFQSHKENQHQNFVMRIRVLVKFMNINNICCVLKCVHFESTDQESEVPCDDTT